LFFDVIISDKHREHWEMNNLFHKPTLNNSETDFEYYNLVSVLLWQQTLHCIADRVNRGDQCFPFISFTPYQSFKPLNLNRLSEKEGNSSYPQIDPGFDFTV
jgi:hypothetical protein